VVSVFHESSCQSWYERVWLEETISAVSAGSVVAGWVAVLVVPVSVCV
jgi:hypothetical protein